MASNSFDEIALFPFNPFTLLVTTHAYVVLGLSGNACGAISAAMWFNMLKRDKSNDKKTSFKNPIAKSILDNFYIETNYQILCSEITNKNFSTPDEHTKFIEDGGCKNLIEKLAHPVSEIH